MTGEVQSFLNEMQSEVFERSSGNDGSAPDFKENVFTEYVMELLAGEVGIVESPEACHFLKEINRGGRAGRGVNRPFHLGLQGIRRGDRRADGRDEKSRRAGRPILRRGAG
jgi:hypothetical protein